MVFHCCSSISFVFKVCLLSAAALSRPAQGAVCHGPGDGGLGSCSSSAEAAAPSEEADCSGQVWLQARRDHSAHPAHQEGLLREERLASQKGKNPQGGRAGSVGRCGERKAKPFVECLDEERSGDSEGQCCELPTGFGSKGRDSELPVLGNKRCPDVFPEVCSSHPLPWRQPVTITRLPQ